MNCRNMFWTSISPPNSRMIMNGSAAQKANARFATIPAIET